jgi:hypothetical protein
MVLMLEARLREQGRQLNHKVGGDEQKQRERDQARKHSEKGRLQLYAAILYLSYRQGMYSPQVADTVCDGDGSVLPPFVRQVLGRANSVARRLWPNECYDVHHSCTNRQKYLEKIFKPTRFQRAYKLLPPDSILHDMLMQKKTIDDICTQFGAPKKQIVDCINRHRRFVGLVPISHSTGLPLRKHVCQPGRRFTRQLKYDYNQFKALHDAGNHWREIAAKTGASEQFVRWILFQKFDIYTGRNWVKQSSNTPR